MNEEQNIHHDQTVPTTAVNNEPSWQNEESNSQTEETFMEVHKHSNHAAHKKKWGKYLLEFLCFFLPCSRVFC